MPISTQDTIVAALVTGLAGITVTNGYQTTIIDVMEGEGGLSSQPNRPGFLVYARSATHENFAFGSKRIIFPVNIWGFVDVQPEDYDNLRKLEADLEKYLATWTYKAETEILRTMTIEMTSDPMIGIFEAELQIDYVFTVGTL